ncbi:hypothetical protein SARC_12271, partial [Sphaeroforma arctica JP610]
IRNTFYSDSTSDHSVEFRDYSQITPSNISAPRTASWEEKCRTLQQPLLPNIPTTSEVPSFDKAWSGFMDNWTSLGDGAYPPIFSWPDTQLDRLMPQEGLIDQRTVLGVTSGPASAMTLNPALPQIIDTSLDFGDSKAGIAVPGTICDDYTTVSACASRIRQESSSGTVATGVGATMGLERSSLPLLTDTSAVQLTQGNLESLPTLQVGSASTGLSRNTFVLPEALTVSSPSVAPVATTCPSTTPSQVLDDDSPDHARVDAAQACTTSNPANRRSTNEENMKYRDPAFITRCLSGGSPRSSPPPMQYACSTESSVQSPKASRRTNTYTTLANLSDPVPEQVQSQLPLSSNSTESGEVREVSSLSRSLSQVKQSIADQTQLPSHKGTRYERAFTRRGHTDSSNIVSSAEGETSTKADVPVVVGNCAEVKREFDVVNDSQNATELKCDASVPSAEVDIVAQTAIGPFVANESRSVAAATATTATKKVGAEFLFAFDFLIMRLFMSIYIYVD